jgi:hypothetical protein
MSNRKLRNKKAKKERIPKEVYTQEFQEQAVRLHEVDRLTLTVTRRFHAALHHALRHEFLAVGVDALGQQVVAHQVVRRNVSATALLSAIRPVLAAVDSPMCGRGDFTIAEVMFTG